MSEKRAATTGGISKQEAENLQIRQKVLDMAAYAMPLIERWSVAHQKLLGDDIAHCMNEMVELAAALQFEQNKKTPCKNLDMKNKALQDFITLAYALKYLKGSSSYDEWTRRSKEIGAMIGGYKKYIYEETPAAKGKRWGGIREYRVLSFWEQAIHYVCRSVGATGTTPRTLACST